MQLPVINLVVNGGRITIKEAHRAASQGRPLIVLEGTQRASALILAALDHASSADLLAMMKELRIALEPRGMEETLHWLAAIADHPRVIRFNFLTRPPEELRELIQDLLPAPSTGDSECAEGQ